MSNVFRIYKRNDGRNITDWTDVDPLDAEIATIRDVVVTGVGDKSGTSIPTVLARMFLFEHALKMVNTGEEGRPARHDGNSSDHELISQYLDLLELVYTKPDSLSFKWWDIVGEMQKLNDSENKKLLSLKNSIAAEWRNLEKAAGLHDNEHIQGVYLIYYGNILLGGTSPLTLVFTSPNAVRDLKSNGVKLLGAKGNQLFYNTDVKDGHYSPKPLHERDAGFRKFLIQYRSRYVDLMERHAKVLSNFLDVDGTVHHPKIDHPVPQDFDSSYAHVTNTGIFVCQMPLLTLLQIPNPDQSGFLMTPTRDYYKETVGNKGETHQISTPLVLDRGAHPLAYWNEQPWQIAFEDELCNIHHIPLWERKLPGFGIAYPYVTKSDFLEDKIIKLDYNINKDKFFTGFTNNCQYLLPLRKAYFNFFGLEDLEQQLTITENTMEKSITVQLAIPIKGNRQIRHLCFAKKYVNEDIVELDTATNTFDMGIFPFYQTDRENADKYCILLGDSTEKIQINLFQFKNITSRLATQPSVIKRRGTERSYLHIENENSDNRFDCIEAKFNDVSGLILPKFKKINLETANSQFVFCIDFGTSNTHITYKKDNGSVERLHVGTEDQQMVLLNQINEKDATKGFGAYQHFDSDRKREFFPSYLSKQPSDASNEVSFPIRSAVFETQTMGHEEMDLFGNVNIGFSLKGEVNEGQNPKNQKFETNLKWKDDSPVQNRRIAAFCKEVIWMIKNKLLLNEGNLNPKIIWTRPEAMKETLKDSYQTHWQNAVNTVFGNPNRVTLIPLSESVAPYYAYVLKHGMIMTHHTLNIDIGGGTTDMLYLRPPAVNKNRQAYSSSIHFAANDLWGGGFHDLSLQDNTNGFYRMIMEKERREPYVLSPAVRTTFDFFRKADNNSQFSPSDVISFVFSHDDQFNFSQSIVGNQWLFSLVFIHYAAILYYISQFIQKLELPVPNDVTFTGMGSLYLNIISKNQDNITVLSKLFLEKFTKLNIPNDFKVRYTTSPKEITAEGAVLGYGRTEINETKHTHFGFKADNADNRRIAVGEIKSKKLKEQVLENLYDFLKILLYDSDIQYHLYESYGLTFNLEKMANFMDIASDSFDMEHSKLTNEMHPIPDSMFFWTLKDSLYRLSSL